MHHAIALGLHTTVLVLLKAALNGRSSKLMPGKEASAIGSPTMDQFGAVEAGNFSPMSSARLGMLLLLGFRGFPAHWTEQKEALRETSQPCSPE